MAKCKACAHGLEPSRDLFTEPGEAEVARAVTRARAPATLRVYRSDLVDFGLWCRTIGLVSLECPAFHTFAHYLGL